VAGPVTSAAPLIVTPPRDSGAAPTDALRAYRDAANDFAGATQQGEGFGGALARAVSGVVESGHAAETQAMQAIAGQGDLTQVVQAVSRAELTLQTATAIRDRVVQAYQDIMRMSI
jgi:flagellar hook-basal body complex protein FliE